MVSRAVLVQHHSFARLPLALATMRPAPFPPPHQPSRMQLRLGPGVTPVEPVIARPMLVEMLDVPSPIDGSIETQHPLHLRRRNPLRRCFAQTAVNQTSLSFLFKPGPVASKLALRHPQQLRR